MPHGNQSESECLLGGKIGKIGKIPGILRVYLENPGYTRVIPALLHGFAPGTTPTAATTTENPAYHFRIPLYHTTPKLIKISPNTSLIPVKFAHCYRSRSGVQVAHPRHRAGACTLNAVGLLPVSRAWRCEGRPPLPHHFVCVWRRLPDLTLPYLAVRRDGHSKPVGS